MLLDIQVAEDAAILDALHDVCEKLGLTDYKPGRISWVGWVKRDGLFFSFMPVDAVHFRKQEILIRQSMKGVLKDKEWRPLLAASLIYELHLLKERSRGVLVRLLLPPASMFIPFVLSMAFALSSLPSSEVRVVAGIWVVGLPILMVSTGALFVSRYVRGHRLKSDLMAARLVGEDEFLQMLEKIDASGLRELRRLKTNRLARMFSRTPSVTERIKDLLSRPGNNPREGLAGVIVLAFLGAGLILLQGIVALLLNPLLEPSSFGIETGALGFLALAVGAVLLQNGLRVYRTDKGFVKRAHYLIGPSIAYWLSWIAVATIRNEWMDRSTVVAAGLAFGIFGPGFGVFAGVLLLVRKRSTIKELRSLGATLREGDICCFNNGSGSFGIAKILKIEESRGKKVYHIRLYKESFQRPPKAEELRTLSLGSFREERFGVGHMPMSEIAFLAWVPTPIKNEPVTEDELDGYYIWKRDSGGVWD